MKRQLITLAIAAALAAPALAQSPGRTTTDPKDSNPAAGASAGSFTSMDRNGDGYISRDEAREATWSSRFSELDTDNDGRLSQSEFGALGSAAGATADKDAHSPSTTGGMGKPGQKQ